MIPQITQRKIGNVRIVDVKGTFSGPWAIRGKERLSQAMGHAKDEKVILNLREVNGLDTLGAKCLLEQVAGKKEVGVFCGSTSVMELINHFLESKQLRIFQSEAEIISAFGHDLISGSEPKEQREHSRMETALPLEFYYEDEGEKVQFRAIVTNVSEGGLFAEYIDLKVAEESLSRLDPYDLKVLQLKLSLPNKKTIQAEGKVAYRKLDGEQVGIGIQFSRIGEREQAEICHFLKLHGFEKGMLNQSPERKDK